jgi:hypothetical protein
MASSSLLRQYTISTDGLVIEATCDPSAHTWQAPQSIGNNARAHKASPIAAGLVSGEVWVSWFEDDLKLQLASTASKSGRAIWSQGKHSALKFQSLLY